MQLVPNEWEREALEAEATDHGLSVEELLAARQMGMRPGRYAELKGRRSVREIASAVRATSGEAA